MRKRAAEAIRPCTVSACAIKKSSIQHTEGFRYHGRPSRSACPSHSAGALVSSFAPLPSNGVASSALSFTCSVAALPMDACAISATTEVLTFAVALSNAWWPMVHTVRRSFNGKTMSMRHYYTLGWQLASTLTLRIVYSEVGSLSIEYISTQRNRSGGEC